MNLRDFMFAAPYGAMYRIFDLGSLSYVNSDEHKFVRFKNCVGRILRASMREQDPIKHATVELKKLGEFCFQDRAGFFIQEVERIFKEFCSSAEAGVSLVEKE